MKLGDIFYEAGKKQSWVISGLRNSLHSPPDKFPPDHITGRRYVKNRPIERDFTPSQISLPVSSKPGRLIFDKSTGDFSLEE